MKVVAWNLGHQTHEKEIPPSLPDLFTRLGADVVLLNEFVDRGGRASFRAAMNEAGYPCQATSEPHGTCNQVFAAARTEFTVGDLAPPLVPGATPEVTDPAVTGFLHIMFKDAPIELVGFRAPSYDKGSKEQKAYWAQVATVLDAARDRPIAFAGDINWNPFVGDPDASALPSEWCDAFSVPNPMGPWSYISSKGGTNRIDHVLHSGSVGVTDVGYVQEFEGRVLAGPKEMDPISDHAALVFSITHA